MINLLERFVLAVGGSLAASIVAKATVIAGFALIGTRLARQSRAAVRHVLLASAFGALLLLPVISIVAPPLKIGIRTVARNEEQLPPTPEMIELLKEAALPESRSAIGAATSKSSVPSVSVLLVTAWLIGAALCLVPMIVGLYKVHSLRRTGLPWADGQTIVNNLARDAGLCARVDVLLNERLPGPIAFGILHPAILLPSNAENWASENMNRALVHELEHVRRGDALIQSLARAVCAVYWFHLLVWIMWREISQEAERSCDDAVIARSQAIDYAEQLVGLARQLLTAAKSPVLYMASRSDLAIRVGAVLNASQRRGRAGRITVALGGVAAAMLALTISPLRTVSARQSGNVLTTAGTLPTFEVATIKPDRSSGSPRFGILPGRFTATDVKAKTLIAYAYNVRDFQISGGPDWINSAEYDIVAKPDDAEAAKLGKVPWEQYREEYGLLVLSLLAERFKMRVSRANKELPVYALVVAKNGPKLTSSKGPPPGPGPKRGPWISVGRGQLNSAGMSLADLADTLSLCPDVQGRKVLDLTGLAGRYNIKLQWAPLENQPPIAVGSNKSGHDAESSQPDSSGPSLFTALQQQLGLKLESTKGTVEIIVIDHIERPSEN